jgi:ADP-ribose pyrophosphatase YjhB (NUDIX family)
VGEVASIHTAAVAGGEMVSKQTVAVKRGVGLLGDRYAAGAGYWRDARVSRDLTLVEAEVLDDLRRSGSGIELEAGELRRNVTTRNVRLNDLVGSAFWVGDALCRATELCEPCRHLEELTGKPLLRPLVHRGGVRAQILTDGELRVGDSIECAEVLAGVGVLVRRGHDVLLGRRLSSHGAGTWSFPGGKPEPGESPLECGLRKLREETGLRAHRGRVVGESLDGFPESRLVFRTNFVEVAEASGEAEVLEPDKAAEWRWWPWSQLPSPLFAPVLSLAESDYTPI